MGFLAPKMVEMFKAGMDATPGMAVAKSADEEKAKELAEIMLKTKGMKSGGKVSSASKRADGCAIKGKTKGKMV